ncbi:MAG: 50S ribosomal protein L5 [Thermoproteota archaeon]|nr:50S ribosomal protein L5 [Thermoproteota archaeon]MDQ5830983.1 50S ribosomal protein L5 [Thermoproteota archaeon]
MSKQEIQQQHDMRRINVHKVVINIGVGRSGEPLDKAKSALLELTNQQPAVRGAKKTVRDFGIHKGEPIGVVVTLRREPAIEFLKRIIAAKKNVLKASSFDDYGNISVGIHEHIDIPGTKYNPDIGIFGMDVNIVLNRPGYRIAKKSRKSAKIGKTHRINREDAVEFFKQEYGVEVE